MYVTVQSTFDLRRFENIVEKGGNAGFVQFSICFQTAFKTQLKKAVEMFTKAWSHWNNV